MRLYRSDLPRLRRLAALHRHKASAEEVLHPAASTERFADRDALESAWRRGLLQPLPDDPRRLHFRIDPRMGELAEDSAPYRGLRPEALALLVYLADRVYRIGRSPTPLDVTSTVRDERYQRLLVRRNPQATRAYSLHTTGFAFDVLRSYGSEAQAAAFQFELERLQALGLVAWVRERAAIHVTVASAARVLVPAVLRREG
jgi:hypothetical protein